MGLRGVSKRTLDLFGRWGDPRSQIRAMHDEIVPVVVADRFRDDTEGSIFGLSAFTNGANNEHSACAFGSAVNDWELRGIAWQWFTRGSAANYSFHVFNPIDPYNPVVNNTVGIFVPALITNRAFTFGTVGGITGTNPALPAIVGPHFFNQRLVATNQFVSQPNQGGLLQIDPPWRFYRDQTFTFQAETIFATDAIPLQVDITYNERPKVSA